MSRRRGLTPEDRELWSRVAKTATPMHPKPRKPAEDPLSTPKSPALQPRPMPGFELPATLRIGGKALPKRAHDLAPSPAEAMRTAPLRMDHKTHKQMTRGKMRPEARLDLHGMTLSEAHPELIRFILNAQSQGLRLVLVITGKGKRRDDSGPIPQRVGALRHQVPHWLHLPPLGPAVLQVSEAHLKHGGGGAYYVYLRRR